MKYAYYPGCSAHSTARDMHESCLAVAGTLGIEMVEIPGWSCCGATSAHQTDRILADSLAAANLVLAKKMGLDMVVNCAECYGRTKAANHEVKSSEVIRTRIADALGEDYDGSVRVRHFVEILVEDIGLPTLRKKIKRSLNGLKVACYYGCYLVRPHEVTGFDDPENPVYLDRLVTALGGEAIEWPGKVDCCGGGLSLTRTDVTAQLTGSILEMARASGAECVGVACPMCQNSLDLRQKDAEKATGQTYNIPVLYVTQLVGLCLGISPQKLGLGRLIVAPSTILNVIESKSSVKA
jgi:heterodisulfide reductase subunit B